MNEVGVAAVPESISATKRQNKANRAAGAKMRTGEEADTQDAKRAHGWPPEAPGGGVTSEAKTGRHVGVDLGK